MGKSKAGKNKMDVKVVGTGKGRFHLVSRKELKMIIRRHEATINSLTNDVEVIKARETKWKQQFDAEVYYKKQALKRIEELELALDFLGNNKTTYIGEMPDSLVMGNDGQLRDCTSHKPADVDEAVEWAKRNGHHFPEGKPEKDRMAFVTVRSADEISQENRKKAAELVKEYDNNFVFVDPNFDEKDKSHQSLD